MSEPILHENFSSLQKKDFKIFDFLFWFILGIIFPVVTGNFSLLNTGLIFIYLAAVYYAGEIVFGKIEVLYSIPSLFRTGLFMVAGGVICGFVFLFIPYAIILYALAVSFFLDLVINKKISLAFSSGDFICLIPVFVILFQTYELAYSTGERYSKMDGDYFYYTAITESLKTNHNIGNAVYHTGLPINYSLAPFLAPAQLAKFSGIPAQLALWGVYAKIIPVLCIGTIAFSVVRLYEILFAVKLTKRFVYGNQLLVSFMFLLLGPLHFLKVFKGKLSESLLFGEGYVLPTGSPGFALAMTLVPVVLVMVFSKKIYTPWYKFIIILLLCIIAGSKLALFVPLFVMLGILSLFWLAKKERSLFFTLLIAFPFCVAIYKLTLSSIDASTKMELTLKGYYWEYYKSLADKYGIHGTDLVKVLLMLCISVGLWLSIKLFLFILSGYSLLKTNFKAVSFICACLVSFVVCLLPGFFISFYGVDAAGNYTLDYNFDMSQFVRGSIFLLTPAGLVFALYLIYIYPNQLVRSMGRGLILVWMLLISFGFFANNYTKAATVNEDWYKEVQQDFFNKKPALMAMLGNMNYSGQVLTTAGVHPLYCSGKSTDAEGFIFTRRANTRNEFFQTIFDSSILLPVRKSMADSVKKLGVDCIIGSPFSLPRILRAQQDGLISPIAGTKWFYRFN